MIEKSKVIKDYMNLTKALPTKVVTKPKYIYLACDNARCKLKEIYIKEGDHVKIGDVIGIRDGGFFEQNIHSTISGTYLGLEKHFHRSGKEVDFMKIENDFKDETSELIKERSDEEISKLTREDMAEIIKQCSLVGLGGSSFPTYIKFQTTDPIDTILVNGIECEPYITSDHRVMLEFSYQILDGIKYAMQAFKAKKAYICIKKKYIDLYETLTALLNINKEENIFVKRVGNFYPQGWEIKMIKSALNIDVPSGVLPSKFGIMDFNVSTCLGIWRAIKWNMPVIERNITITGDGINAPQNFRVRVGTALSEVLPYCKGYKDDSPKDFILGGPMMGVSSATDDVILTRTCTSVIILNHKEYKTEPCVRCGSCVYSCPCGLRPVDIMNATKILDKDKLVALNVKACVECGLCTYVCTSKIRVTDFVRRAKLLTKNMGGKK